MTQPRFGRRAVLGGLAAATTLAATPALAQLGDLFGGRAGGIDLNRVVSGVTNLFEGLNMGEADEIRMGDQLYGRLIDKSGGAYRNRAVQSAIQRFAQPLFATSKRPNFQWEVVVLNDDTVNAWALPGGKLAVNKGLLRYVADEHELAAVISHEIGHAEQSHALEEMRTQKFTQGLTDVGRTVISAKLAKQGAGGLIADEVLDQLEGPMLEMISSGYSRSHEEMADKHILTVFAETGFDIQRAPAFFNTLLQLIPEGQSGTTSLFSTHPGTRDRIKALQTAMQGMTPPALAPRAEGFAEIKRTFPTRMYFRRNYA